MAVATRLVLASASPARLAVLRSAGIEPIVRVSGVDEDAITASMGGSATPEQVVVRLAQAKAHSVANDITPSLDGVCWAGANDVLNCVVVGCDSMLHIDGDLQGKPLTPDVTRERWKTMMGRSGDLLTGHCVVRIQDGTIVGEAVGCSTTTVHFSEPSEQDLEAYLATEEPLHVAGAFTLDSLGGWFVDRIEGDPSSVIGIGLPLVRTLLHEVGLSVAELWRDSPSPAQL
ncbi:Maf family protein [Hoyosella rhizosphaerae]|uniref:Maf family protein n=1 Tax=Hoyosella rhizosphaerae TaxID=1755582 RepID=UPI001E6058C0|nr:nucleoside triphosphate pyrophosphatase [Hoyosella rhizosphaerae]